MDEVLNWIEQGHNNPTTLTEKMLKSMVLKMVEYGMTNNLEPIVVAQSVDLVN